MSPEVGDVFWNYRGQTLLLTDKNNNILSFDITSESIDELYGIVHGLTNYTINDVFYLYFDDGQERDTSNLVPVLISPTATISLEPRLLSSGGSIIKVPFMFFNEFSSNNISIFDENQQLEFNITDQVSNTGQLDVKLPYILTNSSLTLYIYPVDLQDDDLGPLDSIMYNSQIDSLRVENIDTVIYGDRLIINGVNYNVVQKWIEDTPKIGVYNIEEAPDSIINYGQYNRIYKAVLHISSDDILNQLERDLQKEVVNVIWNNEIFDATAIQYNNTMILDGAKKYWVVNITLRRLFSKRI